MATYINIMRLFKISQIYAALFCVICAALAGFLMLKGSGVFAVPSIALILLFTVIILFLSSSKKSFYFILVPIALLHAIYTPAGLNFGPPSYQYIASIFSTDILETKEFLFQIPLLSYVAALAILVLIFLQYKIARRFNVQFYRNKTFLTLSALLVAFHLPIANPLKEAVNSTVQVVDELDKLKNMSQASSWGTSTLENSPYQDYVIVLGESARKDYHHAYGYPIENTPFMSNAKGVMIDGFSVAGTNTVASLRLMFTESNKREGTPNYDLSLVDLIKSAGIKTYWISNQGYLGEYDTPVASLASKSDQMVFLKKGGSFNSTNYSDFELLPKFAQVLEDKEQGKRFILLHLYGSHPLACDRIEDYKKIFKDGEIDKKYDYLNCYISSIKKTDEFLSRVYNQLEKNYEKTHRSFSMIYFSDHGLCHQDDNRAGILFNQNCFSQFHHQVPLMKFSSDDKEQIRYKVFKSGLNFIDGVAHWMGIKNPKLQGDTDLFSNQPDPDDYGLAERIKQKYRKDADPAIDIRPKK